MLKSSLIAVFSILAVDCNLSEFRASGAEVVYHSSDNPLTNPERGLYRQFTATAEGKPLSVPRLQQLRQQGMTLLLRMYYLEKFRTSDLSGLQLR